MKINSENFTHNSHDLFYRSAGDGATTLIMLHGLAGDSRLFHNQIKYFSQIFRVIAPDLPGHGSSVNCPISSMNDYVDAVDAIIRRENIRDPIILGHSMGGAVAMNYYFKNRNRVKALMLVSTSARFKVKPENIKDAETNFESFYESLVKGTFAIKPDVFLAAAKNGIHPAQKDGILRGLKICSAINFTEKLKEITVPVLLLGNRYDPVLPIELTVETGERIKGSKTVIFDMKGHVPFFEESHNFNREIESFINSL
jgi:pimeloyl-ACP methyl ester carboxylesterase